MKSLLAKILATLWFFSCQGPSIEGKEQLVPDNKQPAVIAFYPIGMLDNLYLDTLDQYLVQVDLTSCHQVEAELEKVYVRDQQYRDSIHSTEASKERRSYFGKKMIQSDQINTKIVWHILENVGWTDTCELSAQANMSIWYTLFHSHHRKIKVNALGYVHQAFRDSVLTPELYAYLIDNIHVSDDRKQIYGTYPGLGQRDFPVRTSLHIDSVNMERKQIGLESIVY